ncbi:MAG: minichromosome maintenance protein MCM, partial [Candidatus Nanoarchaeia archaeon]|nr:minichromosome maintenance protein MCM [Candidatus Jingweiarchaeum tengchongense]
MSEIEEREIIEKFEDFLKKFYFKELARVVEEGRTSVNINFKELEKFSVEIADLLLEEPMKTLELFKRSIDAIDLPFEESKEIEIRFFNLPESRMVAIKDIRSKHIGKLICIDGLVRQTSDVRPVSCLVTFECPACGTMIEQEQDERMIRQPFRCPNCGRKGKFKVIKRKFIDTQRIVLEESPETLEGGEQPRRISVFLRKDLVDPQIVKKTCPGSRVQVIGVVVEVPLPLKGGGESTRYDLMIEANNILPSEKEFEEIELTPEDEKEIRKLASDPKIYKKLRDSIAPTIYGYKIIKEAIALQLFGGVKKIMTDGTERRGDIHILLVGDPGVAKSQLLRYVSKLAPKARYVSGKGTTGAGLTAAVVRDEFVRGWSLEAGALVLANKSVVCIDEIDKMDKDDRVAMHEAMELQIVTISKANIQATLRCETTILAAANPKLGRFDPYQPIPEQIDIPPTLINRFDLIFTIQDKPRREIDEKIATHMLEIAKEPELKHPVIPPEMIKKYIAYAKRVCKPKLSDEAIKELKNFYATLRGKAVSAESEVKPIPISPRQLEALVRLAEASARVRLSNTVTRSDARRAIRLLRHCLSEVGIDYETGQFDIDRIVTG